MTPGTDVAIAFGRRRLHRRRNDDAHTADSEVTAAERRQRKLRQWRCGAANGVFGV
jgi:hypothetical protein